ncbi:hypothetical protein [Roseicyclus mahoneyensis]|uniref:Tetratricopeptide repeat-like domain-containing protein n=1 Tax=Roseicyclus mahoneyensis TaxID=164332 RepID=A0A316GRV4_9RHOB|nr:hypothetical protein [Roseicyclus mahoneyensis]PWK62792.1 hypothetical protein C7455_101828 [Roseicyclus mahoneyensis]
MANSDSFIEEVSEELRRDRLFGAMRRWGWVLALIVLGLVGGAAWLEYQRSQERAAAEGFGTALIAALDLPDPEARLAALEAIPTEGPVPAIVLALLAAGEIVQDGEGADMAADRLRAAAQGAEIPRRYRDLALLRAEILAPSDAETARLVLGTLAEAGAPYAALAEEQLALLDLRTGDLDGALERLRGLERSAAATPGLQQRASQLIVALEAGSRLVDAAPAPVPEVAPEVEPLVEDVAPEADVGQDADTPPETAAEEPAPDTGN